jgi:predicted ATPase/DNA-binding CsgD family transcriptional regulator
MVSGGLPGGASGNLPAELTPFVNRERELTALGSLVQEERLIALLGPAGIGKTRLALRLAAGVRREFRDGVWLVQLAPITDGDLLVAIIAGVLGITGVRAGEPLDALEAALSSRHLLLVLDNCEHLVERVAPLVDRLLRGCSQISVVATSRERLGVMGELTWRVPPLAMPDAGGAHAQDLERVESVSLFLERARRANPQFAVTDTNAGQVVELVRSLDGLPLALELAAGWMGTLSPGELVGELDDRFRILVARERAVDSRHSSLWAAIDSSYERLDADSRKLFRQLGVFAGGWNLGSLSAVCEMESGPAVELLGRLVDHSMVTVVAMPEGPTRYQLLETLRGHALARLAESGEQADLQRRFARHITGLAEQAASRLGSREGPRWLAVLDAELDNLRAVFSAQPPEPARDRLRLAVALIPYWHFRGLFTEARRNLRDVLAAVEAPLPDTAAALGGLSWLAWSQGDLASAARHARLAFRSARLIGDRRGQAYALLRLAQARYDGGRSAAAAAVTRRAAEIADELKDDRLVAEAVLQLAQVALAEGRADDAEPRLRESVRLMALTGQVDREAVALLVLGRCCLQQGRLAEAESALRRSLTALRDFALPRHSVPMLESLAAVAAERGELARACRLAGAADGLLERMGARPPTTAPMRSTLVARWRAALATPEGERAFAEGRNLQLGQAIAFALGEEGAPEPPSPAPDAVKQALTRRQLEVARLVARGHSNREIAGRLFISERTVEGHIEQICNKLGFNSRVQVAGWIIREGGEE